MWMSGGLEGWRVGVERVGNSEERRGWRVGEGEGWERVKRGEGINDRTLSLSYIDSLR